MAVWRGWLHTLYMYGCMAWMAAYLIYVGLYGVDGCIPYIRRAVWRGWLHTLYM